MHPTARRAAQALLDYGRAAGISLTVTSAFRSRSKQAKLYRAYLRGESRYPAQPPGKSMHEHGVAFDLHAPNPAILRALGAAWESIGGTWGGRFGDPIHFDARVLLKGRR